MARKKPIFTIETPFERAKSVTLFQNTWEEHIVAGHPEMEGELAAVETALLTPHFVCTGNVESRYQFVSTSSGIAMPTVVVVTTQADEGNVVLTAFKGRAKHKDPANFTVVWRPKKA